MDTCRAAVAVALAAVLAAGTAAGLDQPVGGVKLVLKRTATEERLVFVSRDPAFLFPPLGSVDDPAVGSPGGALVELFSASEGSASLAVPPGLGTPGWTVGPGLVPRLRFWNAEAPAGASPVRLVALKQGRLLKVVARTVGLPLAGPLGAVGIRVTTGTRRSCARFAAGTITQAEAGHFVARGALASALADCSDASLAGGTTTTSTTSTSTTTTLAPCQLLPGGEPVCAGACPAGERCVGEFNPGLGIDCVCLPDQLTQCAGSGYPQCGGGCSAGRVCQAFHLLPGENPELRECACADPGDTCADPPGTCFALGVCPPGQVCIGQGPPTSACGCGAP